MVVLRPRDSALMALVPGGHFIRGGRARNGLPPRRIQVDAFYMDLQPVSVASWASFHAPASRVVVEERPRPRLQAQALGLVKVLPRAGAFVQKMSLKTDELKLDSLAADFVSVLSCDGHNLFHLLDARRLIEMELGMRAIRRRVVAQRLSVILKGESAPNFVPVSLHLEHASRHPR